MFLPRAGGGLPAPRAARYGDVRLVSSWVILRVHSSWSSGQCRAMSRQSWVIKTAVAFRSQMLCPLSYRGSVFWTLGWMTGRSWPGSPGQRRSWGSSILLPSTASRWMVVVYRAALTSSLMVTTSKNSRSTDTTIPRTSSFGLPFGGVRSV